MKFDLKQVAKGALFLAVGLMMAGCVTTKPQDEGESNNRRCRECPCPCSPDGVCTCGLIWNEPVPGGTGGAATGGGSTTGQ